MLTVYLYPFSISTGFDTLTILPLSFETSKLLICKLVFAIFDPSSVHVNVKVSSAVTYISFVLEKLHIGLISSTNTAYSFTTAPSVVDKLLTVAPSLCTTWVEPSVVAQPLNV